MPSFRKLAERELQRGTLVTLARGTFVAPDGERFERDLVHHPGAISMVPLVAGDDGRPTVIMLRQYRAAVDRELLEIPAGKRDVLGEPPEVTARRELAEEIGMEAGRLEPLAEFFNSPGFCDEHSVVFLARDLTPCAPSATSIEERHMRIEPVPLDDVPALVGRRELIDAKSIIGLSLARELLAREAQEASG